jgi:predicted RNA-binding protein with PIN domain
MPYLIDGHNLIGRMRGISLEGPDDEAQLVARLRAYCSRVATSATVYFDGAVIAATREPARAGVTARFVAPPQTADAAIRRHLERLGREAPNWTVVSSDAAVADSARRRRARVETSEAFARRLDDAASSSGGQEKPQNPPGPDEIAAWEAAFKKGLPGRRKA